MIMAKRTNKKHNNIKISLGKEQMDKRIQRMAKIAFWAELSIIIILLGFTIYTLHTLAIIQQGGTI